VVELTGRLRQGDPAQGQVDVGAIIHPPQVDKIAAQVADAQARGATVEAGGLPSDGPGCFFAPTVLSGVDQGATVMREETFGPLLPFHRVDSVEEAVDKANDSHLGLMAYVFAPSASAGEAVARQLVAGTVMVNDVLNTYAMPETPWSGLKQSGLGRVHSAGALRDMCQTRHINVPRIPALKREIWWYPYRGRTYGWMRSLVALLFGGGLLQRLRLARSTPGEARFPAALAAPAE
jgi:succinate-semialdehyde dehydrogenase/glutarate-semialdehyde dehydrogenase